MTEVILAVDFELDLILFELLDGIDDVSIVARPADDVELLARCRTGGGDVVILSRWFPGIDADAVAAIHVTGTSVLGFGDDGDAMAELGITEVVPTGTDAAEMGRRLAGMLSSTRVPPRPVIAPQAGRGEGTIVSVWGTGSAPGRTLTAINLGDQAARQGHRTVIVDADTVSAAVATTLGLSDESSHIAALCRLLSEHRPPTTIEDVPHAVIGRNLDVVSGLTRPDRWPEVRASTLSAALRRLAGLYDLVVVDVSDRVDPDDDLADPYYDRHGATRAALDTADIVLVLAAADPIGLQRLIRLLGTDRAESMRSKLRIVITKVRDSAAGRPARGRITEALERFAATAPDHWLSDDRAAVDAALLAGRTLHESEPRSALTTEIAEVAAAVLPSRLRWRDGRGAGRRRSRTRS